MSTRLSVLLKVCRSQPTECSIYDFYPIGTAGSVSVHVLTSGQSNLT